MRVKRPRLPRPIHTVDRTEAIQGASAHNQTAYQGGTDEQVRIQADNALGQREILLLLADQLVRDGNATPVDRKAAQGNMRTIGNRLNNLCNCLYFVRHSVVREVEEAI